MGTRCCRSVNEAYGRAILLATTVPYLKTATLAGDACTVDTAFYVEHADVLACLAGEVERGVAESARAWRLGGLEEGHEFLGIALARPPSMPEGFR
jgi:hypothetical protein